MLLRRCSSISIFLPLSVSRGPCRVPTVEHWQSERIETRAGRFMSYPFRNRRFLRGLGFGILG